MNITGEEREHLKILAARQATGESRDQAVLAAVLLKLIDAVVEHDYKYSPKKEYDRL